MIAFILWSIVIIAVGYGVYILSKQDQASFSHQLDHHFGNRERLSEEDFYTKYFKAQGIPREIPIGVRKIFEEQFGADFSKISNTDDFSKEMNFLWEYDSLVDVEIILAVEKQFGVEIEDEKAEKMKSIQDIVVCVWEKIQELPNQALEPTSFNAG